MKRSVLFCFVCFFVCQSLALAIPGAIAIPMLVATSAAVVPASSSATATASSSASTVSPATAVAMRGVATVLAGIRAGVAILVTITYIVAAAGVPRSVLLGVVVRAFSRGFPIGRIGKL